MGPSTRRFWLASHVQGAPLDPPRWAEAPRLRGRKGMTEGQGTSVVVLDSGLSRHPWLIGPDNDPLPLAETEIWDLAAPALPRQTGHGTFVAGVVRQYAPAVNLVARRVVDVNGHANDADLAVTLRSLIELDPDVVNISLVPGDEPDTDDEGTCRTLAAVRKLQDECGTVVVTAAGNDGDTFSTERLAPDDELTVVVGALDLSGRPAWFSNTQYVGIWAPGVDVLSTFVHWHGPLSPKAHADDDHEDPHDGHQHGGPVHHDVAGGHPVEPAPEQAAIWPVAPFAGWARWNGTSFAAPAVAGAIATEISRLHHISDRKARRLAGLHRVLASAGTVDGDTDKRKTLSARPIALEGPPLG
jgi:subtilisin family serine protease